MKKILQLSLVFLLFLSYKGFAQDRTITGTVTSTEEEGGLPGVTVAVKGTTIGTVTDVDGKYTLSVPDDANTLSFSYVGMVSQEIPIGAKTVIDVALAPDMKQLSEVVVTAQGMERSQRSLGFAATKLENKAITQGRTSAPMNALQGKIAGVQITTGSGAPGASTKVIIRGYNSLGGNNNPLYVVDGVPISNSANNFADADNDVNRTQDFGNRANDINPDDIETMTVLKGASATALYGSRAANGVILITTKKGTSGELKVDLNSSVTFTSPLRLPQLQNTFGQGWSGHFASEENGSWGPKMDGEDRLWGNVVDNSQQLKPFSPLENNLKDFFETGKSFINTIGISGGTDKTNFYLSYGNTSEDGIIPTDADSYNRNTLSFRGGTKGKKLTTSVSINYVNKKAKVVTTGQGGEGTTVFQEIIQIPRDISIVDHRDIDNKFNNLDNYFTQYAQNPFYPIFKNGNRFNEDRIYGNINLNYAFTPWLNGIVRAGGDVANAQLTDWIAKANYTVGSPNGSTVPIAGRVDERARYSRELNADFMLTASNSIGENFKLNTLLGYNVNDRFTNNHHAFVRGLDLPDYFSLTNSASTPTVTRLESQRRLFGVYGQAEISYRELVYLTVLARNDWSSTLPKGSNSFFYPGANMSFVFSNLLPDLRSILSFGKVRLGVGQTGNDPEPYSINSVYVASEVDLPFGTIKFPIRGANAFEIGNQIGNPNLKPEITSEYEIGADLRFFDGKISFDGAYYHQVTDNQILTVLLPVTSGYTSQVGNFGRVENKGFEMLVGVTPFRTNDFRWDVTWNYTRNMSKVLELNPLKKFNIQNGAFNVGAYGVNFVAVEGARTGLIEGPAVAKDPQGRTIVNATNGIPNLAAEKDVYGSVQPDYVTGINNTISYKGASLSFTFDYRKGGVMYSYTRRLTDFVGNTTQSTYNDRNPFIVPNSVYQPVDPATELPQVDDNGNPVYLENTTPVDMSNVSTYWGSGPAISGNHIIDRTFLKLREVVIGYTLPKKILGNTGIDNIEINLVGRNLLLWTPASNNIIDPETTTWGNDLAGDFGEFAGNPTVRSYGVSLRANF